MNEWMNVQCTVREEDGKLVFETDKFVSVREIQGEDMVEVGLILINSLINGSTQYQSVTRA